MREATAERRTGEAGKGDGDERRNGALERWVMGFKVWKTGRKISTLIPIKALGGPNAGNLYFQTQD